MQLSVLYKKILPFVKPYRKMVIATLLLTFLGSFAAQVNALILKYTVDTINNLMVAHEPLSKGFHLLGIISVVLLTKELVNSVVQFGQKFYKHLLHAKKFATYTTVQRRQPSSNIPATLNQVKHSILSIARMVIEARNVPEYEMRKNARFYYQHCVANLCRKCTSDDLTATNFTSGPCDVGVFSAGSLTAQELIGVASVIGVLPLSFAYRAEVGHTTGTFTYLVEKVPNSPFTRENHLESTTIWIKSVSHLLEISAVQAEEVTCKWVQYMRGSTGRYRDSIPHGIDIVYPSLEKMELISMHPDGTTAPTTWMKCKFHSLESKDGFNILGDPSYWNSKAPEGTRFSPRKSVGRQDNEPSLSDYFPLAPMNGMTKTASMNIGRMFLPILSQQSVVENMIPPFPGHKPTPLDVVGILCQAKYGRKNWCHGELFEIQYLCNESDGKPKWGKTEVPYYRVGIHMKGGKFDQLCENKDTYFPPGMFELARHSGGSYVSRKYGPGGSDKSVRWFPNKNEAKEYACLSLIFSKPHLFCEVASLWEQLFTYSPPQQIWRKQKLLME